MTTPAILSGKKTGNCRGENQMSRLLRDYLPAHKKSPAVLRCQAPDAKGSEGLLIVVVRIVVLIFGGGSVPQCSLISFIQQFTGGQQDLP